MNRAQAEAELAWLLEKIRVAEDFLERAEAFFAERVHEWSSDISAGYEIFLERKREQVCFEKELVEKLGTSIALDRYPTQPDI